MTTPYSPSTTPFKPDPEVFPPSVRIPIMRRGPLQVVVGLDGTQACIAMATLTTGTAMSSVESNKSLFLPAACPMVYDGAHVHEAGFNFYPETSVVSQTTGGNLTLLGTYSFTFIFEWQDAKGVRWRSAPAVPISVLLTGSNNQVIFRMSWMRLTDKQGSDSNGSAGVVRIIPYQTTNGGSVYYEVTAPDIFNFLSDGATGTVTVGLLTDASLVNNELLYTTGGALENEAFPSSSISCGHQRRVFTVRQEDQAFVQYTEEADDPTLAPATNEAYRIPVPPEGGSVVALASMEDKLIILCQHRIYYIFGEGPNRLGQQNGYSLPQLCSGSLGALGGCAQSLALTPEGLWFMSSAGGLRLLNRGLQISMENGENGSGAFLGRESDGLIPVGFTSIRAVTTDTKSQVRWYFSDIVVAYDYQQQVWSRFTFHLADGGAVSARGLFWHSNGTSLYSSRETAGGLDVDTATPQVAETAWIALADVQGFQRIYKMMLLGQAISACTVDLAVGYDYDETWIDGTTALTGTMEFQGIALTVSSVVGDFFINDEVGGLTSGASGILKKTGTLLGIPTFYIDSVAGTFQGAETITNLGATATVSSIPVVNPRFMLIATTNATPVIGQRVVGVTSGATAIITYVAPATAVVGYQVALAAGAGTFTLGESVLVENLFKYAVAGAANPLQLEHPMHKQQCEAVRFRVTITPGSAAEAIRLTNFGLSVGLKKGTFKLASSKRF